MKLSSPSKKEIESIKAIAKNTFKKDKRITIRLYDHDFKGIQKKASINGWRKHLIGKYLFEIGGRTKGRSFVLQFLSNPFRARS